jgi:hypothetical protein
VFDFTETCQVPKSKIFLFTGIRIYVIGLSVRPIRGTLRIVTKRWAWMRWTPWRQVRESVLDEDAAAYGEVVWSWRRDPGVYPPCLCGDGNGDKKGRSPGRARISRKTVARGKPGCPGCTCQIRVHASLLQHTAMRAQSAPGFPCALFKEGVTRWHNPGENLSREWARMFVYSTLSSPGLTGRPSIPETAVIDPKGPGVLDHPHARVMTSAAFAGTTVLVGRYRSSQ